METKINNLLLENGFTCNAKARTEIATKIKKTGYPESHKLELKKWAPIIDYAISIGGCAHGTEYNYRNAQGTMSVAKVLDLYEVPKDLVNPFLVCFSGYMPAAFYTLEAFRAYRVKYGRIIPLVVTGEGGNKGLFADVFNRSEGTVVETEAEAYMRIMSEILGEDIVRKYQHKVSDTDTHGNFVELYQLAKRQGLKEVTFVLCSGQPWYTKRLLAEGMLEFGKAAYADIKVNLVVLDCPLTLDSAFPEGHLSELMLGYIAASLGPLTKDTCSLEQPDFSKERYLLPGVADADWSVFEELITNYSNMGWPNYQELLYGIEHKKAVYNIIMADLRARASFTPEIYDEAVKTDLTRYLNGVTANGRDKYFCRKIYLKIGWYEGVRHYTHYKETTYLEYKAKPENFEGWTKSTWDNVENLF